MYIPLMLNPNTMITSSGLMNTTPRQMNMHGNGMNITGGGKSRPQFKNGSDMTVASPKYLTQYS
jgi:hypothetical protein